MNLQVGDRVRLKKPYVRKSKGGWNKEKRETFNPTETFRYELGTVAQINILLLSLKNPYGVLVELDPPVNTKKRGRKPDGATIWFKESELEKI